MGFWLVNGNQNVLIDSLAENLKTPKASLTHLVPWEVPILSL